MNLDDFSTTVDDMRYINPQVGLDESNAFIENLRAAQRQRTQDIAEDTYNLGTAVPSNLGGLSGAGSYFTSRYQTPQTNEAIANLKAAAQAQALNEIMSNTLARAKQRYNSAYKSYQRRHSSDSLSSLPSGAPQNITQGEVETQSSSKTGGSGSFWHDAPIGDDVAYYGLYRLTRNQGESDQDWYNRARRWVQEQSFKYNIREGNTPTPKQQSAPKSTNSGGGGNIWLDVMKIFG